MKAKNFAGRLKVWFLWLAACVAAFTLLGFFALPPLARPLMEKEMTKALHRKVTIQGLAFNPYRLTVRVRNVDIRDRQDPEAFVRCGELYVNLGAASLFRRALVLKEVRLTRPYARIVRFKDNTYNFSDLLEKKGPETPPLHFSINNIRLLDGSVDFVDEPEASRHEVRDLELSVPFLSNIPYYTKRYVRPHFSARINGTPYAMEGRTQPFSDTHETYFDIAFTGLGLPRYLSYAPFKPAFRMPSGQMDAHVTLSFSEAAGAGEPAVTLAGTVSLKEIAINDPHDVSILKLPRLDISIDAAQPLKKAFHLSEISISAPEVALSRGHDGTLNVETLLPAGPGEERDAKKEATTPFHLQIDNLVLAGGKINFQDLSGTKPFTTILQPVEMKVSRFDNAEGAKWPVHASLRTEVDEEIALDGEIGLDPISAEGTFSLKSLALGKYAPYYRNRILFDVIDGRFDLATRFQYRQGKSAPELSLAGLAASVRALRLRKEGEKDDFLNIPTFEVKDGQVDLEKREILIGEMATDKGQVRVRRDKSGAVNVLALLAPVGPTNPPGPKAAAKAPKAAEKEWVVTLKRVSAERYTVALQDLQPGEPVNLLAANMRLTGENISTAKKTRGKASLSLALNGKGSVAVAGAIVLDPMSAALSVNLKNVDIGPFQPYFTDKVKMTVTGGSISTSGNAKLFLDRNNKVQAGFTGETSINGFASVDKVAAEDFLKWDSLAFTGMNVAINPTDVNIKGISLTHFYARMFVASDGTVNLSHILQKGEEPGQGEEKPGRQAGAPPAPAAADAGTPGPKIRIESVTLQGGKIDFADRSIEPNYSASLTEIGGRVSGLSSEESTTADVELQGKLNDYAPLEITGKINPLSKDLFVDLKASFKDADLSPATPYSAKYTGNTIEKGKLSLDVKYHIVGKKLESQNHVTLDQFTFGDRVNSPDATKLPVRLAVSLLKDRNGVIDLDLPVTGSLDDPKFSIGKIILKIIMNLLEKAATSPFALLGAVFGHGQELSNVEFDYGSSTVPAQGLQKVDTIAKALSDRPALKLEITGFVDPEKDKEALKQVYFMRKLKAEKLRELVKKGEAPPGLDQVVIEPGEYDKYLKMAYRDEKFPKPRNIIGFAKDLPSSEMEKLMITHIVISDDDLRGLAAQRANQVRDIILKQGRVEGERVFTAQPKSLAPEKPGGLKESRVDFALR
ncbi:MAG: DUF748 domain-containing protein [Syntrophorhabdales bacterium]|jgi:uncharacterized protein involved in outer membrane biogenesis